MPRCLFVAPTPFSHLRRFVRNPVKDRVSHEKITAGGQADLMAREPSSLKRISFARVSNYHRTYPAKPGSAQPHERTAGDTCASTAIVRTREGKCTGTCVDKNNRLSKHAVTALTLLVFIVKPISNRRRTSAVPNCFCF